MISTKYTKVQMKNEATESDRLIYVELIEDTYYNTHEFLITDTRGDKITLNLEELKQAVNVAQDIM